MDQNRPSVGNLAVLASKPPKRVRRHRRTEETPKFNKLSRKGTSACFDPGLVDDTPPVGKIMKHLGDDENRGLDQVVPYIFDPVILWKKAGVASESYIPYFVLLALKPHIPDIVPQLVINVPVKRFSELMKLVAPKSESLKDVYQQHFKDKRNTKYWRLVFRMDGQFRTVIDETETEDVDRNCISVLMNHVIKVLGEVNESFFPQLVSADVFIDNSTNTLDDEKDRDRNRSQDLMDHLPRLPSVSSTRYLPNGLSEVGIDESQPVQVVLYLAAGAIQSQLLFYNWLYSVYRVQKDQNECEVARREAVNATFQRCNMNEEDIAALLWMVVASTVGLDQKSKESVKDRELAVIFRHWAASFDSLTDAICAFETSRAWKIEFSTEASFGDIFVKGASDGKVILPALYHVADGRHLAQAHSFCEKNGATAIHEWLNHDVVDDACRQVFINIQEALNQSLSQLQQNLPRRNICQRAPDNCGFQQKCRYTHNIQRCSGANQNGTGFGGQGRGAGRGGGGGGGKRSRGRGVGN
jgi:hypothetical protein